MNNNNDEKNDPIFGLSTKNMKNDILLFKDETLKDFKEAQKKISEKYKNLDFEIKEKLNSYENRITIYETKIMELSRKINTDRMIREKVERLMEFKEKVDESMITEKIRLDNCRNDLTANVNRIDNILKDSVIYPGIIGGICKYKTFHELIDYILTECSQNLTFREKSIIDFKSYKIKLDNAITTFNTQINSVLNTTSDYTKKCVQECEERMKSIYNIYDDRLQDTRIENAHYAIGLEKATDALKKELENLYVVKNELYEKVDNGMKELKNDNIRVIKLFTQYRKAFNLMQHKFTQLSDFIKDIRFRINMKEDVKRKEYVHISDLINFDKKKKGFYDRYDNNYLKKGFESQLKNYINGKIKADELFKKRDNKSVNKFDNNNNNFESVKRKSLSGVDIVKNNSLSKSFNENLNLKSSNFLRGSMVLPKKGITLENEILKNAQNENDKKGGIQEEDNNSSKELNIALNEINKNEIKEYKQETLKDKSTDKLYEEKILEKKEDKNNLIRLKKEDTKIQIVSKDKENDDNTLKKKPSLQNVIKNIFNVKNIMDNIKKQPNSNDNRINKSEKKINNNKNNNNIEENESIYSEKVNEKNETKNTNNNINIINNTNNINNTNINNKPSAAINYRNRNMNEQISHNKKVNPVTQKMAKTNNNTIVNPDHDNKLIAGFIKKKIINPDFNINHNTTYKSLNQYAKGNNSSKNITKKQNYSQNNNKPYNNIKKNENRTAENLILNNFIPQNDINVDENNYLLLKKKINFK